MSTTGGAHPCCLPQEVVPTVGEGFNKNFWDEGGGKQVGGSYDRIPDADSRDKRLMLWQSTNKKRVREYCTTPDGQSGRCILPKDCQSLVDYVDSIKPVPEKIRIKLREYSCAYGRNYTKMCCPSQAIHFNMEDEMPPPDVTRHKNLNLLPTDCGFVDAVDRLRGGEDAGFNEFPWVALFVI
ncbi:hypothetical protein NQ317_002198 [Molorchus minor]|uniref:Clip domain-containing protein n=1 Tax=Molorchus minor TaxID=1323400 RepID=A0ABQ9JPA0_9CUCU|nr:hypothetical protein NQ317_002198 [Molorchus minor]